ncbi:MAG: hypothetical protein K2Z81_24275, partial [Cyanobacteria bacterium]|nr:hypothetical protein [Cyanobacteriota bacterium]
MICGFDKIEMNRRLPVFLVLALIVSHLGLSATGATLYAGVSHTETMDHVDDVRQRTATPPPHKPPAPAKKIEPPKKAEPVKPIESPVAAKPSHPLTAAVSQSAQIAPPQRMLAAQASATAPPTFAEEVAQMQKNALPQQGYLPAFGVAHVSNHREAI